MAKNSAIVNCQCKHDQQDRIYGKQRRVANVTLKPAPNGSKSVRCVVCGALHQVLDSQTR